MTVFQFEENNSDRNFIRRCNSEGLSQAKSYPKRYRGMLDTDLLEIYPTLGGVLVTFDHKMLSEHEAAIPAAGPGIIVVEHSEELQRTLTQKSAERIISNFKTRIPSWHVISWTNTVVRVSDKAVSVWTKAGSELICDCSADWADQDCAAKLEARMAKNESSEIGT